MTTPTPARKAVVVLSGGQDSTTCLFWAVAMGLEVHTLTFDYGQRHAIELAAADKVAEMAGIPSERREVLALGSGVLKGTSPLVSGATLEQYADKDSLPGGLEKTFVPMRNQLFLTLAANRAFCIGASVLVTGVCEEDFGGYPDCRKVFIEAFEVASRHGTFTHDSGYGIKGGKEHFRIMTPLMHLTKADTVHLARRLPGCWEALAFTHTAYDGQYPPTGKDHATLLREKGFYEAGLPDPLVLRAWREGLMELPKTANYLEEALDRAGV